MFQRRFAMLFFGPQVITGKCSHLKLAKGDTNKKVINPLSTK